jgi:protein-ribulosamine 3-kinase
MINDAFRASVEQVVSEHLGRKWRARDVRDMADFASHPAALFADGNFSVFAKLSQAANGLEQLEVELAGLRLLSDRSGVLTPLPIGIHEVDGGALLVFKAVQAVEREARHWRQIGRALARIHKVKSAFCGLETQNYFGPFYQDNRPITDWPTFFAERRLWPRLMGAIDAGRLPSSLIRQIERLIARLPQLCGPEITPSLLHGDAQQNNFISAEEGAYVIDPAVCYGHPEFDLAYIDYFQPVPEDVFAAYREELPIDPGFGERRDLWRIYGYLAIVTVEGVGWLGKLSDAVQKYI